MDPSIRRAWYPADRREASSPMRTLAVLVGICAILATGSLFWLGIGALANAWRDASTALPLRQSPVLSTEPVAAVEPTATAVSASPTAEPSPAPPTPEPTAVPLAMDVAEPTPAPAPVPTPEAAPAPEEQVEEGRNPWILLPQPEPDSSVTAGEVVIEARGRGDADIAQITLELDGVPLPVAMDQRSESIWRASASASVAPGPHNVRASVVDVDGRNGSYRWSFEAGS